jgi:hypothetical protein
MEKISDTLAMSLYCTIKAAGSVGKTMIVLYDVLH